MLTHEATHVYVDEWWNDPARRPSLDKLQELLREEVLDAVEGFRREHGAEVTAQLRDLLPKVEPAGNLHKSLEIVIDRLGRERGLNDLAIDQSGTKTQYARTNLLTEIIEAAGAKFTDQERTQLESQLADAQDLYKNSFEGPPLAVADESSTMPVVARHPGNGHPATDVSEFSVGLLHSLRRNPAFVVGTIVGMPRAREARYRAAIAELRVLAQGNRELYAAIPWFETPEGRTFTR